MASKKSESPFEVEYPPPVSRSELLDALDSLIRNYDRALHEGSWVASELAGMLAEVQKNLGVRKVHCVEIVDQICERAVAMQNTTRTADDQPVTSEDALDSIVAEFKSFLSDLHARLVDPAVRKVLLNAARDYANPKLSEVDRAEAVLVVTRHIKQSWDTKKLTVNSVRMVIRRSKKRRAAERATS